jgi:phage repressor protein C with HTH and peptisase S24 domain
MQPKVEIFSVVRRILKDGGLTHGQLAFALGVNEDRIASLATGKVKKFHPDEVLALVEKLQVRQAFLKTGEGDVFEPEKRAPEVNMPPMDWHPGDQTGLDADGNYRKPKSAPPLLADDFVTVPRYDVEACAGHGAVIHSEQVVDHLAFRADWVRHALGVQQYDLALISVKGDSMEPTLSNGDLILLDMHSGKVEDNAIYALQHNGTLLVKRIQRRLDGSVVVSSDNPRYEAESISVEGVSALRVVGRVVWAGRRM